MEQLKKIVFKLVSDFASETGVDEEYIDTEFETAWKKYQSEFTAFASSKKASSPKKKKDPNAPKRPMSAYMLFANANRDKVRKELPELKFTEVASELGSRWKVLSEKEKKKYVDLAEKEKERYKGEMESYSPSEETKEVKEKKEKKEKKVKEEKPKKTVAVPKPKSGSPVVKTKTPYQNYCELREAEVAAQNPKASKKEIKATLSKMWKELSKKEQAEYKTTEPRVKSEGSKSVSKAASKAAPKKKILEKKPASEDEESEEEPEEEEELEEESEEESEEELDDE